MDQRKKFLVKKLGGENAAEFYKSAQNIIRDNEKGNKQVVVVSAIRSPIFNTTDYLIKLAIKLTDLTIQTKQVLLLLKELEQFHINTVHEKFSKENTQALMLIKKAFSRLQQDIIYYIEDRNKPIRPCLQNDYSLLNGDNTIISLIGFGEVLSSQILASIITEISKQKIKARHIDLSHIVQTHEILGMSDDEVFTYLESRIFTMTSKQLEIGYIPVLSGYMGTFSQGIESTIGRGYTDATAAICIVGFANKGYEGVLEIQKSVRGILTADPRVLYKPELACLIPKIDYITAREITGDGGANAKLLHSQAIRAQVQEAGVKIHLFDPFSDDKSGTWIVPNISGVMDGELGSVFIGGRKNIVFFSISSGKMFQSGILANVFQTVQKYFSVDIVSTSETEITFTIDANTHIQKKLDNMEGELRIICDIQENTSMEFIEYTKDKALIFCVGQGMKNNIGLLARASNILSENDINIDIVSQGRLQRAMVFGISQVDMQKAVNVLHKEFIEHISLKN